MGRTTGGAIGSAEKKRGRKYTAKQRTFLKLYTDNNFQDARGCALQAGYTESTYLRAVSDLKDDVLEITKDLLLAHAPTAARSMTQMLTSDEPIPNAQTRLAAAKEVLDRTGIVKPEKVEHEHKVTGGLFLIPTKREIVYEAEEWEEEDA